MARRSGPKNFPAACRPSVGGGPSVWGRPAGRLARTGWLATKPDLRRREPFRPRHVIWDWNGTLLDDAWLCVEVMNGLLHRHGLPAIDGDRYQALFTFPVIDYYRRLGFDLEAIPFAEVGTAFIDGYQAQQHRCRLQAGAERALDALQARGVGMSVLSASQQSRLQAQADHLAVSPRFVRLLGLDHHYADGKLELGRRWMAELGVAPGEVLLVGDTDHDLEVARAIGVRCALVPGGHQSRARLEACGGEVWPSLEALAAALEAGPGAPGEGAAS